MKNSLDELRRLFDEIGFPTKRCLDCKPDEDGGYGGPCATCDRMRSVPDYEAWTEKLLFECDDLRKQYRSASIVIDTMRERIESLTTSNNLLLQQVRDVNDPSPEAQLRRYRAAVALVAKPPSIAEAWTDHGAAKVRRANGKILAAQTKEGGKISLSLDGYWDTTVSGATLADLDKLLTAAGWQLCGGGE